MSELQPQVITNTSELASILAFKPYSETHQTGVCKGTSSMPLQPSYPVGLSDHGVDDITFSIRSGPVGTECFWTSQWLALQQYWYIAKIEFEQVKTGNKCMVETGSTYMTLPHYNGLNLEGGAYAGNYDEVMFPENQRTALEPTGPDPVYLGPSNPTYISTMSTPRYVRPMLVRLACGLTLVNDNGVTLKLKAITLLGPPGADRRTALRSTFGIPPEVSR
ncbi:MAG: hypothetical protein JO053_04025 [Acidobacteria bacterium]|nr:hypothetical protein [Acidobacteriota bacterium]